jgi:hypothetical protein
MSQAPQMDPLEFKRLGYLQEVNRRLLHRLGLALALVADDAEGTNAQIVILDDRADDEGWLFRWDTYSDGSEGAEEMELFVDGELSRRDLIRQAALGFTVQPTDREGRE